MSDSRPQNKNRSVTKSDEVNEKPTLDDQLRALCPDAEDVERKTLVLKSDHDSTNAQSPEQQPTPTVPLESESDAGENWQTMVLKDGVQSTDRTTESTTVTGPTPTLVLPTEPDDNEPSDTKTQVVENNAAPSSLDSSTNTMMLPGLTDAQDDTPLTKLLDISDREKESPTLALGTGAEAKTECLTKQLDATLSAPTTDASTSSAPNSPRREASDIGSPLLHEILGEQSRSDAERLASAVATRQPPTDVQVQRAASPTGAAQPHHHDSCDLSGELVRQAVHALIVGLVSLVATIVCAACAPTVQSIAFMTAVVTLILGISSMLKYNRVLRALIQLQGS